MAICAGAGGFTLVELLIVISAVAMLATIAFPTYLSYKVRANRVAAQTLLIDLANRQQSYFLDARAYSSTLADLGAEAIPPDVAPYYVITEPAVNNAASPPTFSISAMARGTTIQARDGDLSINSLGVRSGHW